MIVLGCVVLAVLLVLVTLQIRRLWALEERADVRHRELEERIEKRSVEMFKQHKVMTRRLEQSKRVADKVVQDTARIREQVDVVLLDPKVQRALNRHEGS
jgi:predicted Holliday junction resolvase-like endonuclease